MTATATMKLKPFAELIKLSAEKLDEALAPVRARKVKAQAELELSQLEADIIAKDTKVQELCTKKEGIDLPLLLDTLDDIEILERRKRRYAEVLRQLFPEKK